MVCGRLLLHLQLSQESKDAKDMELWQEWLMVYCRRLEKEEAASDLDDMAAFHKQRASEMDAVNPAFTLRNYVAQNAITK